MPADAQAGRESEGAQVTEQQLGETNEDYQLRLTRAMCCHDCGRAYFGPGWIEAVIPSVIWNQQISPTGDEGGLLCINCIAIRCARLGLENVPVLLAAGPLVAVRNEDCL